MSRAEPAKKDLGQRTLEWWQDLQKDRGAAARLRRVSPSDAMALEPTLMLFRRLGYSHEERGRLYRVATLACVLAQVREDQKGARFANAIGRSKMEDVESAALKPLRFQRLITAVEEDEIARSFRRALAIVGSAVDVADLAKVILYFDSDSTKRKLTFDYFGAGIAAPQEPSFQNQTAI